MAPERKHSTDAILDAVRALLLDGGPRAATVSAISSVSGAPPGTLHHRFGNREKLLAATWLRALERFQRRALAAVGDENRPPIDAAVALALVTLTFAREEPGDARLLLSVRRSDVLSEPDDERIARLNAPLESAVRRLARGLYGRADARSVDRVTRVVVDLPYAAVRRYAPELPRWLEAELDDAARRLLDNEFR